MRVPTQLADAFRAEFQDRIARFVTEKGLLPEPEAITSHRFLSRSVVPHVKKLSALFNRSEKEQDASLEPYWKESSNPENMRLAYFLYFMPSNLFRVGAVWSELARLGFKWKAGETLRAVEFGAGPASGACGIAAGEHFASSGSTGLPTVGNWALIEQDQATLNLGCDWAANYFASQGMDWGTRPFHRKVDLGRDLLPKSAPSFNLWVMSYFLNESATDASTMARNLIASWKKHLDEEGVVILVEPALKLQSRRLLELRKELLIERERAGADWLQILLPCLGHQACGALAKEDDWCHEQVTWWRPPYFKLIDEMAELDRKTLPFSYLVLTRSKRKRSEILPELGSFSASEVHRLVSPAHAEGQDQEFFLCGQEGKRRARYRSKGPDDPAAELERGDIVMGVEIQGDVHASRVKKITDRK